MGEHGLGFWKKSEQTHNLQWITGFTFTSVFCYTCGVSNSYCVRTWCLWSFQAHPCWSKPEQQLNHLWVFRGTWAARGLPGARGGQSPAHPPTTRRPGDQPHLSIRNQVTAAGKEVRAALCTESVPHINDLWGYETEWIKSKRFNLANTTESSTLSPKNEAFSCVFHVFTDCMTAPVRASGTGSSWQFISGVRGRRARGPWRLLTHHQSYAILRCWVRSTNTSTHHGFSEVSGSILERSGGKMSILK